MISLRSLCANVTSNRLQSVCKFSFAKLSTLLRLLNLSSRSRKHITLSTCPTFIAHCMITTKKDVSLRDCELLIEISSLLKMIAWGVNWLISYELRVPVHHYHVMSISPLMWMSHAFIWTHAALLNDMEFFKHRKIHFFLQWDLWMSGSPRNHSLPNDHSNLHLLAIEQRYHSLRRSSEGTPGSLSPCQGLRRWETSLVVYDTHSYNRS